MYVRGIPQSRMHLAPYASHDRDVSGIGPRLLTRHRSMIASALLVITDPQTATIPVWCTVELSITLDEISLPDYNSLIPDSKEKQSRQWWMNRMISSECDVHYTLNVVLRNASWLASVSFSEIQFEIQLRFKNENVEQTVCYYEKSKPKD